MNKEQSMVKEFHETFNILSTSYPAVPDSEVKKLRVKLIKEEFEELQDAFNREDLVAVADGLADLLYVIYGTAVSCGIDIEPIFDEVHRSNMTKVGGHKRDDGKWVKPSTYDAPKLLPILVKQQLSKETLPNG